MAVTIIEGLDLDSPQMRAARAERRLAAIAAEVRNHEALKRRRVGGQRDAADRALYGRMRRILAD